MFEKFIFGKLEGFFNNSKKFPKFFKFSANPKEIFEKL